MSRNRKSTGSAVFDHFLRRRSDGGPWISDAAIVAVDFQARRAIIAFGGEPALDKALMSGKVRKHDMRKPA